MNRFEHFACGQIFSTYPDISFNEIIELCYDDEKRENHNLKCEQNDTDDESLCLCEQYEDEWWENIPTLLNIFIKSCEDYFPELKDK